MNLVVRTYPIGVPGTEFVHQIPRGNRWLETRHEYDAAGRARPVMAWQVDNESEPEEKVFRVVPETEVLDFSIGHYRGGFQCAGGRLHVFEVIR